MKERSERLIKYGFIKPGARKKYEKNEDKGIWVPKNGTYDQSDADEEIHEQATVMPAFRGTSSDYQRSGYPDTIKKYRLIYKSPSASMEETYYWLMDHFKVDEGFPDFRKIVDVFSASEQSSFWGQAQQRMGLQQDRATQYMATIGKMVKDLFQLVRELRIIEERLDIYQKAPESKSADVTLKGLYIDMVEGGSKNPSSVYGIAQQVGFTILPDLFFNTHVYDPDKVDSKVADMKWNDQVKNVLKRKLFSYVNWKQRTEEELKSRFKFTLKYLRQHWNTIQMYMAWVKPYLRNVARMRMPDEHLESEDIVSSFETSITEVEVLAMKPEKKGIIPCCLMSMRYTTQPEMDYHQEGYQHRGPVHVGQVEFQLRIYGWTPEEIENFARMKQEEDMDLIGMIDGSVKAAMDALGDELRDYLRKADEKLSKFGIEDSKPGKQDQGVLKGALNPFGAIFKGFGDLFGALFSFGGFSSGPGKKKHQVTDKQKMAAAKSIFVSVYQTYKNYKKSHGMVHW